MLLAITDTPNWFLYKQEHTALTLPLSKILITNRGLNLISLNLKEEVILALTGIG
jgi:hypothetical protein